MGSALALAAAPDAASAMKKSRRVKSPWAEAESTMRAA